MKVNYKKVKTINEFIEHVRLRVEVFIIELGMKPGWEPDEDDRKAAHYIAKSKDEVVATARFRKLPKNEIKIERMVTKKKYRGKGIGCGLVKYMLKNIKKMKPRKIWLRCQLKSMLFYEKCGFKAVSKLFDMYGIQHIDMEYQH